MFQPRKVQAVPGYSSKACKLYLKVCLRCVMWDSGEGPVEGVLLDGPNCTFKLKLMIKQEARG